MGRREDKEGEKKMLVGVSKMGEKVGRRKVERGKVKGTGRRRNDRR